ncbi:peptidase dimerization domain-containing protein, partial [Bacillus sp. HC-TM]
RGPAHFDVEAFGASFAYTMDGGPLGGLEYESFNAAGAKLTFNGTNTHPGTAKNKMRNATKLAMDLHPSYKRMMHQTLLHQNALAHDQFLHPV